MAARDQAIFLETFIGLQRALKRRSYDSDSDSEIEHSTNRGSKLKQRARFVRQGQLGAADGLTVFAETIDYAGHRRDIISRNPPLIDDEGYEVDSDEEDDAALQEAEASAADQNPYASIHLENLLAPLTAVTDLPTHPSLSRPFTSKALTELATQGGNWKQKESAALWKVKPLLIKLCGDHIWVDSGLFVTSDTAAIFDNNHVARVPAAREATEQPVGMIENGPASSSEQQGRDKNSENNTGNATAEADAAMVDASATEKPTHLQAAAANGSERAAIPAAVLAAGEEDDGEEDFIHPLFLAPRSAHPEPNLGLPEAEAEDVRRLLQLWVQKQEEVSRGTKRLHEGLLRADRLRRTVLRWAKAEAHCGPNRDMSDGEDWYDQEEWGLEEDLKKGHDEEEEDQQLPNKKTRSRK